MIMLLSAACSDTPRLAPPHDDSPELLAPPEPQVFASGTLAGAGQGSEPIDWDLVEIVGFSHAVSLTASTTTTIVVRSASRQGDGDDLWLVGTTIGDEGPVMVFGGADGQVDAVVLVNGDGEELRLDLREVPDQDWYLTIEQLPLGWADFATEDVEVVALRAGTEVAREQLPGFHS